MRIGTQTMKAQILLTQKRCELKQPLAFIKALPVDVRRQIYDEYFACKEKCDLFLEKLKSEGAQRLEYQKLVGDVLVLLDSRCAMEYLCEKDAEFRCCYNTHYVEKKKMFVRIDTLNSFVLSILMYKYHWRLVRTHFNNSFISFIEYAYAGRQYEGGFVESNPNPNPHPNEFCIRCCAHKDVHIHFIYCCCCA